MFFGKNKICVNRQITDKRTNTSSRCNDRWVWIILVNIHNTNTESGQPKILNDLSELMKKSTQHMESKLF